MNFSISKLRSYKELYTQAVEFMKAISDQDVERAEAVSKKNINPMNLYVIIIQIMQRKKQIELQLHHLKEHFQNLQQQLKRVLKKQKKAVELNRDIQKLQILRLIQRDLLSQAKERAHMYNMAGVEQIVQQLWEYRFITKKFTVIKRTSLKAIQQPKVIFDKKRKVVEQIYCKNISYKQILNETLLQVLKALIGNSFNKADFKQSMLSTSVIQYFGGCFSELKSYREQIDKGYDRQMEIFQKLQTFLAQLAPDRSIKMKRQTHSFYDIIDQFLEKSISKSKIKLTEAQSVTQSAHSQQNYSEFVPIAIRHSKTQNWLKTTQLTFQEHEAILQHLYLIDPKLKSLDFDFKTKAGEFRHVDILRKAVQVIDSFASQLLCKKAGEELQKKSNIVEDQLLMKLKLTNIRVTELTQLKCIRGMAEVILIKEGEEDEPSIVCDTLISNMDSLMKAIQKAAKQIQFCSNEAKSSCHSPKKQSHNECQTADELKRVKAELYQQRKHNQKLKDDNQMLVKKIANLEKLLANSTIISDSQIYELSQSQLLINQNKKQVQQLQQMLRQKTEELKKFHLKMPKLISLKLEEEKKKEQVEIERLKKRDQQLAEKLKSWQQNYNNLYIQKEEERKKRIKAEKSYFNLQLQLEVAITKIAELEELKSAFWQRIEELQLENEELRKRLTKPLVVQCGIGITESFFDKGQADPAKKVRKESQKMSKLVISGIQHKEKIAKELNLVAVTQNSQIKCVKLQKQLQQEKKVNLDLKLQITQISILKQTEQIAFRSKIFELESKSKLLEEKIADFNLQKNHNLPQNAQTNHLFAIGMIFDENSLEERQYLINSLVSYLGPIRKTQLLYRFDSFNKANPHKYIDKHSNIVVVLKTIYGKYVAAYSREMIDSAGTKVGFGLLMGLWNQRTFEILPNKKPVTYDDYFIIFGNSELRLKSQETKVFSNFGINNAYFNSEGRKVDAFLGEGTLRQLNFQSYEIYTLDLKHCS